MSLGGYLHIPGKYFDSNDRDLPDKGLFDVENMAPDIRAQVFQPGAIVATNAGAGTRLLTWNPLRRWAWVINNHATENAFIVFGPLEQATGIGSGGILVANGGTLIFGLNTDLPYVGPVSCFTVNAGTLSVGEG
jgi:hypothetical protein